jgi:hypothetical protein
MPKGRPFRNRGLRPPVDLESLARSILVAMRSSTIYAFNERLWLSLGRNQVPLDQMRR